MFIHPTPFPDVNILLDKLLSGVRTILGENFVRLYLYGSLASGDFDVKRSDVDFVVITVQEISNTVLPNHAEIVQIIEKHIHLAQADEKLFGLLLQYINHISVYRAIRDAGEYKVFPLELGEAYPNDLFAEVQRRTLQLQSEYNKLIEIS